MTVFLVAALTIMFTLQSLFCKLFSKSYDSGSAALTSTVFSISYGLFTGVVTFLVAGLKFSPSRETLWLGLINAAVLLLYNISMIQTSRLGPYSFQMLSSLFGGIVVPMIYGAAFLQETLSGMQLFAIGLMLVSFVLLNHKGLTLKGGSGKFFCGCAVLFLANGFYGVLLNLQQLAMHGAQRNEMIMLTFIGMAVLSLLLQLARDPRALARGFRIPGKPLAYLLLCCVCAATACHLILYVLTLVDATVLYTIDNGGVLVLSVLCSCVLFQEKLDKAQLGGMALAVGSIVLLSL